MKKILLAALCLYVAGAANAQTVSVPDVEALPGETVAFSLNLNDGKADTYTSLQFNVTFPAEGFITTGDYTISSAWKNASATIGDVDAEGLAVVPASSAEVISGSAVENLLTVNFTVDNGVALGEYDVTLSAITFGYGFTDKDIAPDVTFKVKVVAAHTIVLDESSAIAPEAANGVNVCVKRTIKAGEWSTICLPFSMTEEQVKAAFGNDVELGDFNGAGSEFDSDDKVQSITVYFDKATAIEANHPYIIKVTQNISEFTVDNVDINPDEGEALVEFDNGKTGSRRVVYSGFYGVYKAGTVLEKFTLFLSDNQFWYSAGLTKMKAYRAYFEFLDILSEVEDSASGARIAIYFNDDQTTGIETMSNVQCTMSNEVYDLQGRRVSKPGKGIYVIHGKKVVK